MTKHIILILLVLCGLVQFSFGQKTVSPAKRKLVAEMVRAAEQIFPYEIFEGGMQKATTLITADFENGIAEKLKQKIDSFENMPAADKEKLKAGAPEFARSYAKMVNDLMSRDFEVRRWVNESASRHFRQKFSVAELKKVSSFLKTPSGQNAILAMRKSFSDGFKGESSPEPEQFEKDVEQFLKTGYGSRFFDVVIDGIMKDIEKKIDGWEAKVFGNFDSFVNEKEFTLLLDKFVRERLAS